MGNTLKTTLHHDGRTYQGEALLETSELLFLGEKRLVVAFQDIEQIETRDGQLHLRYRGGEASIDLGAQAEKWAEKIRNPKTVVQKLGVKAGQVVSLIALDDAGFLADLEKVGAIVSSGRAKKNSDAIFYGAATRGDLAKLDQLRASLAPNGALWVIRPKGVKEITEADVMNAGKAAGLVDVKVVRFSETHTAEKFVIPLANR